MENLRKQGVKRKREHTEDIASKLRGKLHHGLKEVRKATKKAKAFELQRIVKKLKDARKSGDEENIRNFEAQLEWLKHIDLNDIAVRSLRSKIKKDALLSKNADCQEAVSSELSLSSKDAVSKSPEQTLVESRMLSSKILSSEVTDVINSLKLVLGAEKQEAPSFLGDHDDTGDSEESNEKELGATVKGKEAPPSKRKTQSERNLTEGNEDGATEDDDENDGEEAWAGFDSIHDGEPGQTDASAESSDSGRLHSQDDDSEDEQPSESGAPGSYSPSSLRVSLPKKARPATAAAIPKQKVGKAGESAFLPSLAVGFISGSDSEWSESEARFADVPAKKNRRGQRARKAIWEKKYGRNANHLKKLRSESLGVRDTRNAKDAKVRNTRGQREGLERGARSETAASRGGEFNRGRGARGNFVRGHGRPPADRTTESEAPLHSRLRASKPIHSEANRGQRDPYSKQHTSQAAGGAGEGNLPSANVRPHQDWSGNSNSNRGDRDSTSTTKPLHPSWEAKRRLKEKESPAIVPSVGTKIKFT